MSDAQKLRALIERVKTAKGPERQLDQAIVEELGWRRYYNTDLWWNADIVKRARRRKKSPYSFGEPGEVPHYTSSLDAAASLVLAEWWVGAIHYSPSMNGWWVILEAAGNRRASGNAATETLARVSAALCSRLAEMETERE